VNPVAAIMAVALLSPSIFSAGFMTSLDLTHSWFAPLHFLGGESQALSAIAGRLC
jgi:hypothetical protein